jgi:hypothetical protein
MPPHMWVPYSDREDQILRESFADQAYSHDSLNTAARKIPGRSRRSICRRAMQLGLTRTFDKVRWTQAEDECLSENAHLCVESIQQKLKAISDHRRTCGSIIKRINHHKLRTNLDGLNLSQLSDALGLEYKTLAKYTALGYIKGTKLPSLDIKHLGETLETSPWFYSNDNIRIFVALHPGLIDLRKVSAEWFIDLLLGNRYLRTITSMREKELKPRGERMYAINGEYPMAL